MARRRCLLVLVVALCADATKSHALVPSDPLRDSPRALPPKRRRHGLPLPFPRTERAALLHIHARKMCGTSLRVTMKGAANGVENGGEWTMPSKVKCFSFRRSRKLVANATYTSAHPHLYIEFHCDMPHLQTRPSSSASRTREALMQLGFKVATVTLLRNPLTLVPSFYFYFGPGRPVRAVARANVTTLTGFVRAHAEITLCELWGFRTLCSDPLSYATQLRASAQASRAPGPGTADPATSGAAVAATAGGSAGSSSLAAGLPKAILAALPSSVRADAEELGRGGYPLSVTRPFSSFLRTCAARFGQLTSKCGVGPSGRDLRMGEFEYLHCAPDAYLALIDVQTAWARYVRAVHAADRSVCDEAEAMMDRVLGALDVVGTCERWDASFLLMAQALGIQNAPPTGARGVARQRHSGTQDAEARAAMGIAENEACAMRIYAAWARRLDQTIEQQGDTFRAAAAMLRTAEEAMQRKFRTAEEVMQRKLRRRDGVHVVRGPLPIVAG